MKKNLTIALLAILCGCNDNTLAPNTKGEVTLTLTGNTVSMSSMRNSTSNDLQDGTEVGVYVLQTSGVQTTLASTPYVNGLYTVSGSDGAFVCANPFVLYDGISYVVCAYSPRLAEVSPEADSLPFNHGTDVLYAPSSNVTITGTIAAAALSFSHKMSQISFTLASGVGSPDLTNAALEVSGFTTSCTMNLADGTLTPGVASGAVINQLATLVCIVPGTLALTIAVRTIDGKTYDGVLERTFAAGSCYNYTLTLNKTEETLGVTGRVVDWETVSGGDVEMNEYN